MNDAETLRNALRCSRGNCSCGSGRNVHCPSHDDTHPSLTVDDRNGTVLVNCKTGCSQDAVLAALKERRLWAESDDDKPIPIQARPRGSDQLVKSWGYVDMDGKPVAVHGRFESGNRDLKSGKPEKRYLWRLPHEDGEEPDWKGGLRGRSMDNLPLYNVLALLARPDDDVWFVEGEPAADACTEAGLLAVSLPGGAGQKRFGEALNVLAGRKVILWPDNDDEGRSLMTRVAGILDTTLYVAPPDLPAKGDAADFFETGGTVAALEELATSAAAHARLTGPDAVTVTIPFAGSTITFEFSEMVISHHALNSMMRVIPEIPGQRRTPFSSRLNLESSSGRDGLRRELEKVFAKEIAWAAVLSEACDLAKEAWRSIDLSVRLSDVELPESRRWAVERWAPHGVVTIPFGMGGSCKSLLMCDMCLHALLGAPWLGLAVERARAVLVIDYEDEEAEWRLRAQQICDANGWDWNTVGDRFHWMPGRAIPIADQMIQLRKKIDRDDIDILVVDSAVSAAGGDLIDASSAARLINGLTSLGSDFGTTSFVVAHNTKAEDSRWPYGNVMWNNLARATHYIEQEQVEGDLDCELGLFNRKANRGTQRPIAVRIRFPADETGPISIVRADQLSESLQSQTRNDVMRIIEAVTGSPEQKLSVSEIHEQTSIPEASIRRLASGSGYLVNVGDGTRGMWAVRSERDGETG